MDLSPKARGIALDQFDYVRDVHNSFSTEIDVMQVDSRLQEDFLEAAKKQRMAEQAKKRKGKKRQKKASFDQEDDETGFHFIAYVPAGGAIWRMDGMEPFPRLIAPLADDENWLLKTLPDLQGQWASVEANELEFSLLSLTANDDEEATGDIQKMHRTRENWGPFIAHMLKLHAEKGDLKAKMQG